MIIPNLPGTSSDAQYTNITFFTKGGMGEIYKAYDSINKKEVAVKLITIHNSEDKELLEREIEISLKLTDSHIVKTHFSGEIEIAEIEYLYIIQDFYSNGNLKKLINPNIPIEECFSMMNNLLTGLKYAHKIIIHRDLKPENVLINSNNELIITDFGLAKYIDEKTRTKSYKGSGTIPYMAPECWLSDTNSISMDIYSLGIIFFEILTGKLPFYGRAEHEYRDFHVYGQLPNISSLRKDIPVKIMQIITKMTQKRIDDRYRNVNEIIDAMNEAFLQIKNENNEAERLASIGHKTIESKIAHDTKRKKEEDDIKEYKIFLNYHISELFEKIKNLVLQVNSNMEIDKITIKENPFSGNLLNRTLTLSFNRKSLHFEFYNENVILDYEKSRLERNKKNNLQNHGFMAFPSSDSIFKSKSIIYIGQMKTNFQNPELNECFGFNLLLVKNESDLYGKWFVASFSDSALRAGYNRNNFALRLNEFLENFDLSFHMHIMSVDYHQLNDNDISKAIEEILR